MKDRNQFAGSYLELFTSSMFFFIALVFLLTWLAFYSPYELFENGDRLAMMNYVLITLFALGPVMGILAGIAFDTLPLVYNIPHSKKRRCATSYNSMGLGSCSFTSEFTQAVGIFSLNSLVLVSC